MSIYGAKTRGVRLCGLEFTWGSVDRNQMVEILLEKGLGSTTKSLVSCPELNIASYRVENGACELSFTLGCVLVTCLGCLRETCFHVFGTVMFCKKDLHPNNQIPGVLS
jgi:hypothetical protein